MDALDLALDWTPNTNHTGFYLAASEGYYADRDIDVTIRSPADDDYEVTPAKRVATGRSTLAIAPTESVLSYQTHPEYASLVAIAAVCQRNTSAIASLASSDVSRPADLDGRTYASYGARFEEGIVRQLVRNDGGTGEFDVITPPKLSIPDTLGEGRADATWVFMPWEGLDAERAGRSLTSFRLEDYEVPYGYTPLVLAHPDTIADRPDFLRFFLAASARGYRETASDPERGVQALLDSTSLDRDEAFLLESQRRINEASLTPEGEWGSMERERWDAFVSWLTDEDLLTDPAGDPIPNGELDVDGLYTTRLLD